MKAKEVIYSEYQMVEFTAYFVRWEGYLPENISMCIAIWKEYPDKPPVKKGDRPRKRRTSYVIADITTIVCDYYNVPTEKIMTETRKREIVQARQVTMFITKNLTKESLREIGKRIGRRGHATVLHACKTVLNEMDTDTDYRLEVADILSLVSENVPEVSRKAYQLMLKVEDEMFDKI